MTIRLLQRTIPSHATSDGAGVHLRRSLGATQTLRHDPFLMLDEFHSDDPQDYLPGFPPHPHRGFEAVTYMIDGRMRHEDSIGNRGDLGPGDVQWMKAARGIVHSEMPQQTQGRMRGFQLWINLPARSKMSPAAYRDLAAKEIPQATLDGGGVARVIRGTLVQSNGATTGPVLDDGANPDEGIGGSAASCYWDLDLPAGARFEAPVPAGDNAFFYCYEGEASVGPGAGELLAPRAAGLLGPGDRVVVQAGSNGARLLFLSGRPLGEPIVQYGPFVMNTRAEVDQAVADFQRGDFGRP